MTLLFIWSTLALIWWIFCRQWVAQQISQKESFIHSLENSSKSTPHLSTLHSLHKNLSIFKPISPTQDPQKIQQIAFAIESFLVQMTPDHELLLGISKKQLSFWEAKIHEWKSTYPHTSLQIIHKSDSCSHPNPKIRWNHHLASFAQADLWLWSDADIQVPPHYLKNLLIEWETSPYGYLTNPYILNKLRSHWGIIDHFFIRFEFLPGVFLLDHFTKMKSAYGAGILFHRQHLSSEESWNTLGTHIADDYQLAQMIGQGRLSKIIVKTSSQDSSFDEAFRHYQRWHKTIRWCDPWGYFGMILLNPLLGWILLTCFHPTAVLGMILYGILESLIVWKTFSEKSKHSDFVPSLLWPWMRTYTWIWVWFPNSVIWGERKWFSPIT